MRYFKLLIILSLFNFSGSVLYSQALDFPINLGFENGFENTVPPYWIFSGIKDKNDSAVLISDDKTEGIFSTKITNPSNPNIADTLGMSHLHQSIDALYYRGKKIRLSADIRTNFNIPDGKAFMRLMIRETEDNILFEEFFLDDPIISRKWKNYQIETTVPGNANQIKYGFLVRGTGEIFIDNVKLEVIEPNSIINEPPKVISEKGIANLTAFAKLYSLIRFYHPSDASDRLPWDLFILNSIKEIEDADNNAELRDIFKNIFQDIAPSLIIDEKPIQRDALKPPYTDFPESAYYFYHKAGFSPRPSKNYSTSIENTFIPTTQRDGAVIQFLDIKKYRGKKIEVSADINYEKMFPSTKGQLWLRCDREESRIAFMLKSDDKIHRDNEWITYSLDGELPDDATNLRIGMVMLGEGEIYYDNIRIMVEGEELFAKNYSFESSGNAKVIAGWNVPESVEKVGYQLEISDEKSSDGEKSLKIFTDYENALHVPNPGEIYSTKIADSIYASIPICLWADSSSIYPKSSLPVSFNNIQPGFVFKPEDRASRLTALTMAWSRIYHFNINGISKDKLEQQFTKSLSKASTDVGNNEFLITLNQLVGILNDPNAGVWNMQNEDLFTVPFLWKKYEDKLIIYQVLSDTLDLVPGSEVLEINGIPTNKYIENAKLRLSVKEGNLSDIKALAMIKSGKYLSDLLLKLKDTSGNIYEKTLLRDQHAFNVIENRPYRYQRLTDDVHYVDLSRFNNKDFKEILNSLSSAEKIIFDMRGDTKISIHFLGFLSEEPFPGAQWHVKFYTKPFNINGDERLVKGDLKLQPLLANKKVIFLSDERATGYSEAILSTVKYNNLGTIIGLPTEGSFGDQIQWILPGFYVMNIPVIKNLTPDGNGIGGNGIQPDILIDYELDDSINDEDTLINSAVKMLQEANN